MGKYVHRKTRNRVVAFIFIALVTGIVLTGYFAADYLQYVFGKVLLEQGEYEKAAQIFDDLAEYRNSADYLEEARYGIASKLHDSGEYLRAASIFSDLEEFKDSQYRQQECYYKQAEKESLAQNYDLARTYYVSAGSYRDAKTQVQRMIYALGHEAFLLGNYDQADDFFAQLDGSQSDYGNYHFRSLDDAAEFLDEQFDELQSQISFHIGEEPDEDFYARLRNMICFQRSAPAYYENDKLISMMTTEYYAGDKILDAWENGKTASLEGEEKEVLELALSLVEQAEEETDSEIEKEKWLHDWLCDRIVYESPNMDVNATEYVRLRELNCIGAMLDGKANCQGYTDAFYLLANLAGFEVTRLSGEAGEGHIWNMILLDGQWYIVDVTFDDLSDTSYEGWTYTYFNAPLDTDTYQIYGGEDIFPGISKEFDAEKGYFGYTDSCFSKTTAATEYLAGRFSNGHRGWDYAVIEGKEVDSEEFERVLKNSLTNRFVGRASWGELLEYYNGNTYISICWE